MEHPENVNPKTTYIRTISSAEQRNQKLFAGGCMLLIVVLAIAYININTNTVKFLPPWLRLVFSVAIVGYMINFVINWVRGLSGMAQKKEDILVLEKSYLEFNGKRVYWDDIGKMKLQQGVIQNLTFFPRVGPAPLLMITNLQGFPENAEILERIREKTGKDFETTGTKAPSFNTAGPNQKGQKFTKNLIEKMGVPLPEPEEQEENLP